VLDIIAGALRRAAQQNALLVILDDVHWADRASLLLLQFLTTEVSTSRVLLVATYRDVELANAAPLIEVLASVCRHRWVRRLPLFGLADGGVGQFIDSATGVAPTERLARLVAVLTGGTHFSLRKRCDCSAAMAARAPWRTAPC
jgi:hypothetical protein